MSIKEHPPQRQEESLHVPVLLKEALNVIRPRPGESYLDLTAGYGGHASAFLKVTKNYQQSFLIDRDDFAMQNLQHLKEKGANLICSDFYSAAQTLLKNGHSFDLIFVDLGVSSPQLDYGERGFSFSHDGELDMRMDRSQAVSAKTLVNTLSAVDLEQILISYGEERPAIARRIAEAIIASRPIETTFELADLIKRSYRGKWMKKHPATRTFQALRIAVNDELSQIEKTLTILPGLLNKGGRVGIISFHSLEDRLVKRYFAEQDSSGYEAELSIVNKKPITELSNDVYNPRSRSAKLRVAVKK